MWRPNLLRKEVSCRLPERSESVKIASAGIIPQAYLKWAATNGLVFRVPFYDKPPGPFVIRFLGRRGIDVFASISTIEWEACGTGRFDVAIDHTDGKRSRISGLESVVR